MKKVIGTALAAGAAMLGAATPAAAETAWSFNAGVATDYIFRGIDQTPMGDAQAFGGADLTVDSFYAGVWVSSTGYSVDPTAEYDLYLGFKPVLGGVTLDIGAIYYGFLEGDLVPYDEANTFELKAAASVPLGGATLGGAVYWTPDFLGEFNGSDDDAGLYYEGNLAYTFENKATISGALGYQSVEDYSVDGYTTWNAGVTYPILDNLSIDARYIASEDDAYAVGAAPSKVVGTLKATF